MQIIPAINCADFECVEKKLQKIKELGAEWVHIDIADGIFISHKTWNNPKEFQELRIKSVNWRNELDKLNIEAHLMVKNFEEVINDWIKIGAKRIIVHLEAKKLKSLKAEKLKSYSKNYELGLAISPETPVENLIPFLNDFKFIQILAVNPGLSGQKFQPLILNKIKFLKENYSDMVIEVDGGINLETARMCKEAGADILILSSYIWKSDNPKGKFSELLQL